MSKRNIFSIFSVLMILIFSMSAVSATSITNEFVNQTANSSIGLVEINDPNYDNLNDSVSSFNDSPSEVDNFTDLNISTFTDEDSLNTTIEDSLFLDDSFLFEKDLTQAITDVPKSNFTVKTPNIIIPTTLTANNLSMDYVSDKYFIVRLTDYNNQAISGETIIITVNGVNYSITTDINGESKLKINLNPGTYNLIYITQVAQYIKTAMEQVQFLLKVQLI